MTSNSRVWLIIPVHNRRETTRKCLDNLASLGLPKDFSICVVDDGCTDGTSEMLAKEYPAVHVLKGDGNLYWGGGIAKGMEAARAAKAEIHLWLNDDCLPAKGSLELLVNRVRETRGICGGVCYDPDDTNRLTYEGTPLCPLPTRIEAQGAGAVLAESLNGNLVAIHASVVDAIGLLPAAHLPHFGGDIVYTLRAHRCGRPVEIHPGAEAVNRRDDPLKAILANGSILKLWKEMGRTASPLHFNTYWFVLKEFFGCWAWLRWPAFFIRMIKLNLKILRIKI